MHTRTHNNHAKYATTKYFRKHLSADADADVLWIWMRMWRFTFSCVLCLLRLVFLGRLNQLPDKRQSQARQTYSTYEMHPFTVTARTTMLRSVCSGGRVGVGVGVGVCVCVCVCVRRGGDHILPCRSATINCLERKCQFSIFIVILPCNYCVCRGMKYNEIGMGEQVAPNR